MEQLGQVHWRYSDPTRRIRSNVVSTTCDQGRLGHQCCYSCATPDLHHSRHPGSPVIAWQYRVKLQRGFCIGRGVRTGEIELLYLKTSTNGRRRSERGQGKLKALVVTAVLAFVVYAAFKLVPPYLAEYQLSDKMDETARFATVNGYSEDQIRDQVFRTIQDLEIPATKDDIKVVATKSQVKISVDYTVPVNLIVIRQDLHFTPTAENRSIF
jgi:hypothetical protein